MPSNADLNSISETTEEIGAKRRLRGKAISSVANPPTPVQDSGQGGVNNPRYVVFNLLKEVEEVEVAEGKGVPGANPGNGEDHGGAELGGTGLGLGRPGRGGSGGYASLMVEETRRPASGPLRTWVRTPCRMGLDQRELARIELMPVEVSAVLPVARMVSLVLDSGTRAESSFIPG